MPDFADNAQAMSDQFLRFSIDKAKSAASQSLSAFFCEDCGSEIPPARREAVPGCVRCVACQTEYEESL